MTPTTWLVANGIAVTLLIVVLAGWVRRSSRARRYVLPAAVCIPLVVATLLVLLKPAQIPIGWITVLMEGRSLRNVQQLYGRSAHFGSGFASLIEWVASPQVTTLAAVVHANVCFAVINTLVFFFIASYVLRSWWISIVFTLGYVGNLNSLHAAVSETPAMFWAMHFWLGCIAAAVINDAAHAPRWLRLLALLWLALLVVLAASLRLELLVLGVPAVAVGAAQIFGWEPWLRQVVRRSGQFLHAIVAGRLWLFGLVAAAFALLEFLPWPGSALGWIAAGLRPLNLSFLTMPGMLGIFLPFGLVALFVLGTVHALRGWFTFFLLPITVLILFKVYASGSHGVFFERLRYLTFLTPTVLFLALFGFRELAEWARRWGWPSWWKRVAVLLLVMSCTGWQTTGPKEIFRRRQQLPGVASPGLLLAWNQQTEVRYLLDLVARYPQCVFVTKTAGSAFAEGKRTDFQWVMFGRSVSYRESTDGGGTVEQIAAQLAPAVPCVLYYRSLDCDLVGLDGCQAETQGRTPLEERVLDNLPYSDISEYGAHHAVIRLGIYAIAGRGDAASAATAPPS